jgi:hypothetical protein
MAGMVFDPTLDPDQDRDRNKTADTALNLGNPENHGWILRVRTAIDLTRHLLEPEKWSPESVTIDASVAGTAKSSLATYHLVAMHGSLNLFLEGSDDAYDLTALLQDESIGDPLLAIANQWQKQLKSEQSLLVKLPATAALPILELQERQSWFKSAGSHDGARRAAVLSSLLGTCRLNKVKPREWLSDVLARLNVRSDDTAVSLLPMNWKSKPVG